MHIEDMIIVWIQYNECDSVVHKFSQHFIASETKLQVMTSYWTVDTWSIITLTAFMRCIIISVI